jgi:hypothetical protein
MAVEREFPLPKIIPSVSEYAPRHHREADDETDKEPPRLDLVAVPPRKVNNIKGWIKMLTYREMCELVEEIFNAHEQLFPQNQGSTLSPSITRVQLSDVLDKVAHGD